MAPIRIALASPERQPQNDPFVASLRQWSHDVVLLLADGTLPQRDGAGTPLLLTTKGYRWRNRYERLLLFLDRPEMLRRRIATLLQRERVQVMVAGSAATGEELIRSCQRAHVPLVVRFHGSDGQGQRELERYSGYRNVLKNAAAIVVSTKAMEERVLRLGIDRTKVFYNAQGVDLELFGSGRPDLAPPHVLTVGRFVDANAPLLTLLAFQRLVQQRPDARLTMVGEGVLWEGTHQAVNALGLAGSVDLCGPRTPVEVAALMQRSRLFLQQHVVSDTGQDDGTPLAVLEAMASGLPVVATHSAGLAGVVAHSEQGLLSDARDVQAMTDHLVRLVDDPSLAFRLGAAGREYVEVHHRMQERIVDLQMMLERVARNATY
ncbi:MAG: glycosyltransferase family 4 protein [Flavobacteriales bacterium]